jgi:hypothetical protein
MADEAETDVRWESGVFVRPDDAPGNLRFGCVIPAGPDGDAARQDLVALLHEYENKDLRLLGFLI